MMTNNGWNGEDFDWRGRGQIWERLRTPRSSGTTATTSKIQVKTVGVQAQIRNKHNPNKIKKLYVLS
jgi:hypothetical protein